MLLLGTGRELSDEPQPLASRRSDADLAALSRNPPGHGCRDRRPPVRGRGAAGPAGRGRRRISSFSAR